MPIFRGEHCEYSCVHLPRRTAERERDLSARTLRVFLRSAFCVVHSDSRSIFYDLVSSGEVHFIKSERAWIQRL
jgi:hypothetical protein